MVIEHINTENPNQHWKYIECAGSVTMDLGCGRWDKVERRDPSWLTTPEFFIDKGATIVYGIDTDPIEIEWFNNTVDKTHIVPICSSINTVDDIIFLYNRYNPTVVKSDIEGFESLFLQLPDEEFRSINFYAIETHSEELYVLFLKKFFMLNYEVIATINLTHAPPMKVIFARKL